MRRRTVLAAVGTGAATAVAGCTGLPEWSGAGTTSQPGVSASSLTVRAASCGTGGGEASVTAEEVTVSVAGTVLVSDGCQTVELDSATVDAGVLRVVVASVEREGVEGCVQCLTAVDYDASITLSGGLPERVVVVHESQGDSREAASVEL